MEPVYLTQLISSRNTWLTARQSVVARNIANSDSPGYKSKEIVPFKDFVASTQIGVAATNKMHIKDTSASSYNAGSVRDGFGEAVKHSGNTVKLEHELVKAGEVSRSFSFNNNILRSFHRMLAMSVRG